MAVRVESIRKDLFYGVVYGLGLSAAIWTLTLAPPTPLIAAAAFVFLGCFAGRIRFRIPHVGRLSMTYAYILSTLLAFGLGWSVVAALSACLVSGLARGKRIRHTTFDLGTTVLATSLSGIAFLVLGGATGVWTSLIAHLVVYALIQHVLARLAIRLCSGRRIGRLLRWGWMRAAAETSAGGLVALVLAELWLHPSTRLYLAAAPMTYAAYVLRRVHLLHTRRRLDARRRSAERLRWVTRALSKSIAANGGPSEADRLAFQLQCLAVGERLELSDRQMEALAAAAMLCDVGRLARHAPSRPSRHGGSVEPSPRVGSEILAALSYPEEAVALVRHQHERWDGEGTPDGLEGARIPLGAQILATVSAYQTLTADRPGRPACSPLEAEAHLVNEAGGAFHPLVVDSLFDDIDDIGDRPHVVRSHPRALPAPEATVEDAADRPRAQRDLHWLYDIARAASYPLSLEERLTLIAGTLVRLIPHVSLAVYVLGPERKSLIARYARGLGAESLGRVRIPLGQRVSGRAVDQRRALSVCGDSATSGDQALRADFEQFGDDRELGALGSCLAAPLVEEQQCLGCFTLYNDAQHVYSAEDRRLLVSVAGYVTQAILDTQDGAGISAAPLTDLLTGLPNSRFLGLELAQRISRPADPFATGFGLLGVRVSRLAELGRRGNIRTVESALTGIARRLAGGCREGENVARLGQDLFVVLTSITDAAGLLQRWQEMRRGVQESPLELAAGIRWKPTLLASQAIYPQDGIRPDALLANLERRLRQAVDHGRRVLPFRTARRAS